MKITIYKSNTRGFFDHGWLITYHSFSFAHYFDPERINFGALRVLNDDIIKRGMGFGSHPHNNMEIITIPLEGALEHKDSMDHVSVIRPGEVQVMSAGKGLTHSEYNHSHEEDAKILQIWIFPREKNLKPRYDQAEFEMFKYDNKFGVIVNPDYESGLFIHQDAWISIAEFEAGESADYKIKKQGNGAFIFLIDGTVKTGGEVLNSRDAIGLSETEIVDIKFVQKSRLLVIDVPMDY